MPVGMPILRLIFDIIEIEDFFSLLSLQEKPMFVSKGKCMNQLNKSRYDGDITEEDSVNKWKQAKQCG